MLLLIDVGNSNIVFALSKDEKIIQKKRISTKREITSDEIGMVLSFFFKNEAISSIIFSSVIPPLNPIIKDACIRYLEKEPILFHSGMKTGVEILYEEKERLGMDRVINVSAAYNKYKKGAIVIDFGTATTFDYVSKDGKYLGGAISPGIRISADCLFEKAYQLPRIAKFYKPVSAIAKRTIDSINTGIILGYACLVDGMIEKIKEEAKEEDLITIATGGLSYLMKDVCKKIDIVDEDLTLYGLITIYRLNRDDN